MANNNKFTDAIKSNWKPILWGIIPIIIIVIIFALPLKTVPIEVTETYWATEMKQEPYSAQETYDEVENYIVQETRTNTVYDSWVYTNNWDYSFAVNKPGSTVTISTYGTPSYYYSQPYIFYSGNHTFNPFYSGYSRLWPWDYSNSSADRVTIKVSYPEDVTKQRVVTKTRTVTKYREVPTQVQKERKTTQYTNVSIWSYLFMDQKK